MFKIAKECVAKEKTDLNHRSDNYRTCIPGLSLSLLIQCKTRQRQESFFLVQYQTGIGCFWVAGWVERLLSPISNTNL